MKDNTEDFYFDGLGWSIHGDVTFTWDVAEHVAWIGDNGKVREKDNYGWIFNYCPKIILTADIMGKTTQINASGNTRYENIVFQHLHG